MSSAVSHRAAVTPSVGVRADSDQTCARLHAALRSVWDRLPQAHRSATGASELLGVERTTCQRVAYVATRPYEGPEVVARLPGIRALRDLIEALGDHRESLDEGEVESTLKEAAAAVDGLDSLYRRYGGSRAKLVELLEQQARLTDAGSGAELTAADASVRERLFECGRAITGRAVDVLYSFAALVPDPDDPGCARLFRLVGSRGSTARADALPLVTGDFRLTSEERAGEPSGPATKSEKAPAPPAPKVPVSEPIPRFSTTPLPLVHSRERGKLLVRHAAGLSPDQPLDLARLVPEHIRHPGRRPSGIEATWMLCDYPARSLTMELLVHHELAAGASVIAEVHLWDHSGVTSDRAAAWQTRVNTGLEVRPISPGDLASAAALARDASPEVQQDGHAHPGDADWPRLALEMRGWLIHRTGYAPEHFAGHRFDATFPVWRTGYCLGVEGVAPPPGD